MRLRSVIFALVSCALLNPGPSLRSLCFGAESSDTRTVLWQIGQKDGKTEGFALAPNAFSQYREDPIFLVGVSDPARDWPYVQPGPADVWAGGRPHTATVLFGLESPPSGDCELVLYLANTHYRSPPRVAISANGKIVLQETLLPGGPDATIMGDLKEAKPCEVRATITAGALRTGTNVISISTQDGSWMRRVARLECRAPFVPKSFRSDWDPLADNFIVRSPENGTETQATTSDNLADWFASPVFELFRQFIAALMEKNARYLADVRREVLAFYREHPELIKR